MDCCSTPGLRTLSQALTLMLERVSCVCTPEQVSLEQALDRITARPVTSPLSVPPFDNSAMDGYAVRTAELAQQAEFPVAGKAFAGAPFTGEWPAGTCVRIMTGAAIPDGCDAVIMQEQTESTEQGIRFTAPVRLNQNIRRTGEDIRSGDAVVAQGEKLTLPHLPVLASLGIAQVEVCRRLKVAIFSTGDELREPGQPLENGQIYDSNRLTIRLMLEKLGCEILDLGIIADDPQALRNAFHQADNNADLVITSGGVSVGEADYTKEILDETGDIGFWKLAIKPGKPFAFGRLQHAWFCGLPGNPVSAAVTFYQLVQPLITALSGHTAYQAPQRFQVRCDSNLKKTPGRLDFQRGILRSQVNPHTGQTELSVTSTGHQGSHVFSSFTGGNCFIVLEQERGAVTAGEWVTVEPFNALLGG